MASAPSDSEVARVHPAIRRSRALSAIGGRAFANLYVLGGAIQDDGFRNAVMDASKARPTCIADTTEANLPQSSPLRRLLATVWVSYSEPSWYGEGLNINCIKHPSGPASELWSDVVKEIVLQEAGKVQKLQPTFANRCSFQKDYYQLV